LNPKKKDTSSNQAKIGRSSAENSHTATEIRTYAAGYQSFGSNF
jgi:hypothetical protein